MSESKRASSEYGRPVSKPLGSTPAAVDESGSRPGPTAAGAADGVARDAVAYDPYNSTGRFALLMRARDH
jgi:hypothetical protein